MINNFEHIEQLMSFENENDFYHIQILKRRKENPEMKKGVIVINNIVVNSFEEYRNIQPHIIHMCSYENARAYIRVNKRNYEHLSHEMNIMLGKYMKMASYKPIRNIFDKVVGRYHSDKDKKWVVDIDWNDPENGPTNVERMFLGEIKLMIREFQNITKKEPLIIEVPTRNGVHLITRPFNLQKFKEMYPKIDIHKDRLTLLFIP